MTQNSQGNHQEKGNKPVSRSSSRQRSRRRRKKRSGTAAITMILLSLAVFMGVLVLFRLLTQPPTLIVEGEEGSLEDFSTFPSPSPTLPHSDLTADGFRSEDGHRTYYDEEEELDAVYGIDVSSHQGSIDWTQVAESGVQFAIIRTGYRGYMEGELHQDEWAAANISAAMEAGLQVGLYVFSQAVTPQEAIEEAELAIAYADYYGDIQYPIFYDWEPVGDSEARTAGLSTAQLTANAKAFCDRISQAGYEPGIYFNLTMAYKYYNLYDLQDYKFWLAEYQPVPTYPYVFHMWQYTSKGQIPGISTYVDIDLSFPSVS